MSDRAGTEKNFNRLLEEFRKEVLPQVVDNWGALTENQQKPISAMNNLFCGLHLLVGMADVAEESLKKFERNFLDGKLIGSAAVPELKMYHRQENCTLRLLRTSSKAFAVGEDEKNGVSLFWKTYLNEQKEKNLIQRFKHNRFNLIFLLGQAVFYHRNDISNFLDTVEGTKNSMIKAVSVDIKEDLYAGGARALGLVSKFLTGPLWRLLETPGHILDINLHFKTLMTFLKMATEDSTVTLEFIHGENSPFDISNIPEDEVVNKLTEDDDPTSDIIIPILQSMFHAFRGLLCRLIPKHLPGGIFDKPTDDLVEKTKSVMKHNKLPEFVF